MSHSNLSVKETRQFSFRDMLAMVFRRKWIILSIFFVMLATGISASFQSTSEFMATAKVLIRRDGGSQLARTQNKTHGLDEEMNTEIEILRSTPVLDRAVDYVEAEIADLSDAEKAELFPAEDESMAYTPPTPGWLNKNLQAEPVEQSNVIMIRFRHENPATARMLADAVSNAYVVERVAVRRNPMLESFFQDHTAGLKDRLLDLRMELGELQIESGVYDEEWQQRLNLGTLDELRTELLRVRVRRETEQRKLAGIRQRMQANPDLLVPILEFEEERAFQEVRMKLIDKQTRHAELLGRFLPDHPKVKQSEAFIALLEQDLKKEITHQIEMREGEIMALRGQEAALADAVRQQIEEMNRIPRFAPMIRQVEREINNTAELYELVGTKMVDTQITESEDQRMLNAKVLSPATVRISFVQQRKGLFAVFAALLGLSLGLALAFLLEGLDNTFRTPDDVEINLGVPLLGSVPELKPAARR